MLVRTPTIHRTIEPAAAPVAIEHIRIRTEHCELALFVGTDQRLYQLAFGSRNDEVHDPKKLERAEEFYPPAGNGHLCEPAIQAFHADGNTSTDLAYLRHSTQRIDDNISLTRIELKDRVYPFFVTLNIRAFADEDMIEQWTEIHHAENSTATLFRFASSSPLILAKDYWLTQFHGDYMREATIAEERLTPGIKLLDSKLGVRATRFRIPSCLVALNRQVAEEEGAVYGGSLAWSGSFQLALEIDPANRLRAVCGINPFGSHYQLDPGKSFVTPPMLWTFSEHGKGQISRNFHRWARKYGIRDGDKPRPVILNNWEATGFAFDEKRIISLFDGAADFGAELFLLDDGWFGGKHPRDNDRAGLGDWQVNARKLPHGLSHLAKAANQRGIDFGIWIEPEMLNPSSELYEKHPEWTVHQPHREHDLYRHQLALDLARPEVREFAAKVVDDILRPNPGIRYVKWDANRYITQPGSTYLPPDRQSHVLIDYNIALYDVFQRLASNHPDVMGMACAGGGGRADFGAMRYFHSFWASDNTDPRARVFIQWGFGHFFPACAVCAHVTRMGDRPLKFAIDVAMSLSMGLDIDVSTFSPEERDQLAAAVKLYKTQLRPIVQQGDLYRLESPYDHPRAALNYVSADRSNAALFAYQITDGALNVVKPRGLDPAMQYRIREVNVASSNLPEDGCAIDGATLMRDGVHPSCQREFDSSVILLSADQ